VKILKKCKESIPSKEEGGKVIIIDTVLEDPKERNEFVRAQHNMDMLMMVLFGSKERTKKEWEKLFIEAGFNKYKIIPALDFIETHTINVRTERENSYFSKL